MLQLWTSLQTDMIRAPHQYKRLLKNEWQRSSTYLSGVITANPQNQFVSLSWWKVPWESSNARSRRISRLYTLSFRRGILWSSCKLSCKGWSINHPLLYSGMKPSGRISTLVKQCLQFPPISGASQECLGLVSNMKEHQKDQATFDQATVLHCQLPPASFPGPRPHSHLFFGCLVYKKMHPHILLCKYHVQHIESSVS